MDLGFLTVWQSRSGQDYKVNVLTKRQMLCLSLFQKLCVSLLYLRSERHKPCAVRPEERLYVSTDRA